MRVASFLYHDDLDRSASFLRGRAYYCKQIKQRQCTLSLFYVFVFFLGSPVGYYVNHEIRTVGIIGLQMHCIIVRTIHAFVHHENAGFECCAFTGLEYHRTDG